ncbi:hypothetical protein L195_g040915, partial [Trifolium pratense]
MVRLNHYPPCPFPHLALGDIEGLQVKRKSVGHWIPVKPT